MYLHEKYRPKNLGEVLGQKRAVRVVQRMIDNGDLPGRAFWLSGLSGTGKTSLAKLIAAEVADEEDVKQVVGRKLTEADLRSLWSYGGMFSDSGKRGRALIIDEAHGLRADTIEYLLGMIEADGMPSHAVIVFTTRLDPQEFFQNKDDGPALQSRCTCIELTKAGLYRCFADAARRIAEAEGLADDDLPAKAYDDLVLRCNANFRDVLTRIEAGVLLDYGEADDPADAVVVEPVAKTNGKRSSSAGIDAWLQRVG